MNAEDDAILKRVVRSIVVLLVEGDYDAAVKSCAESRLTPDDVRRVIDEYGRCLMRPPDDEHTELDAVRVRANSDPTWSVRIPLWTIEEGRSDLTLELTISHFAYGLRTTLDDIHVL